MQTNVWWHVYFVENQNVNVFIKLFNVENHDFFFFNFWQMGEFGEENWCKNSKKKFYLFNIKHLFKIFKTCSHEVMFTQLIILKKQNQFMQNVFGIKNKKIKKNRLNIIEQKKDFFCCCNCTSKLMILCFFKFDWRFSFKKNWFNITWINKI